jgi:DNA-binding transcriptional regulator YiaG
MDKNYRSDILRAVHEGAVAMYEVGGISDARMKEYDKMCLAPHIAHSVDKAHRTRPAHSHTPPYFV